MGLLNIIKNSVQYKTGENQNHETMQILNRTLVDECSELWVKNKKGCQLFSIPQYQVSKYSDIISVEDMIGIVFYMHNGKTECCINNINVQTGDILLVNIKNIQHIKSTPATPHGKAFKYWFNQDFSSNHTIAGGFGIKGGTFAFRSGTLNAPQLREADDGWHDGNRCMHKYEIAGIENALQKWISNGCKSVSIEGKTQHQTMAKVSKAFSPIPPEFAPISPALDTGTRNKDGAQSIHNEVIVTEATVYDTELNVDVKSFKNQLFNKQLPGFDTKLRNDRNNDKQYSQNDDHDDGNDRNALLTTVLMEYQSFCSLFVDNRVSVAALQQITKQLLNKEFMAIDLRDTICWYQLPSIPINNIVANGSSTLVNSSSLARTTITIIMYYDD